MLHHLINILLCGLIMGMGLGATIFFSREVPAVSLFLIMIETIASVMCAGYMRKLAIFIDENLEQGMEEERE